MAEKPVKAKQPANLNKAAATKTPVKVQHTEKPKVAQARVPEKTKRDEKDKPPSKLTGRLSRWWRETIGELRKVSWPTMPEARRLTKIVLVVVFLTAVLLGLLDFVFSRLVGLLVAL